MTKECIKCNLVKNIDLFSKNSNNKDGKEKYCKCCISVIRKIYSSSPEAKLKTRIRNKNRPYRDRTEYSKKYRLENKEKVYESSKKWYDKNKEKVKILISGYKKTNRILISDSYAKELLVNQGFPKESITPELIEVKRIILKTKRL